MEGMFHGFSGEIFGHALSIFFFNAFNVKTIDLGLNFFFTIFISQCY